MLSVGITGIESASKSHFVVVVIGNPFAHLLVVAIFTFRAHVTNFFFPFSIFHAIEIGAAHNEVALGIVFLVWAIVLPFVELFLNLFLSIVVIPNPNTIRFSFLVVAHFLKLTVMIVELPFA